MDDFNVSSQEARGPKALHALIDHEPIVRCLGAHDLISAKLIEKAGVECMFVGGFGISASMLGLPDMNMLSLTNMMDMARRICQAVSCPVIVDGDTGHGDLHNVQRTVQIFEQIGAAGILIEDQTVPKRCGHFEGKQVIAAQEMVYKIVAAIDQRRDENLVIVARTDARAVNGIDNAIERANMYGEAGADLLYLEAPLNEEELIRIPKEVGYPVMVNMLTGGKTPTKSVDELKELGYKVVLWPVESVLVTAKAIERMTTSLLQNGRLDDLSDQMMNYESLQKMMGLNDLLSLRDRVIKKYETRQKNS